MKYIKYLPIALMLCLCSCKSGNATSQATDIPQGLIFWYAIIGIMSTLQILTIFIIRTSPNKPGLIIATF